MKSFQGFFIATTNRGTEDPPIGAISPMARGEGEVRLPFSCVWYYLLAVRTAPLTSLLMKTIKLTPAQAAFLDDRPGECVAECVGELFPNLDDDGIAQQVEGVRRHFGYNPRTGEYKPEVIKMQWLSNVEQAALLDHLQGSTVCGQLWDSIGMDREAHLAYARAKRTLMILVDKFRAAGLNVTFIPDA